MNDVDHFLEMSRSLARIAALSSAGLRPVEVDVALTARRGVLDVLAAVHRDVTGAAPGTRPVSLDELARHPAGALGTSISQYPAPQALASPSGVLAMTELSLAGVAWQGVVRHALLARHAWEQQDPPTDGQTAWARLADVAATAQQLILADQDLTVAAREAAPDRDDVLDALERAAACGLGVTARETLRLAAAGPLEIGPIPSRVGDAVDVTTPDFAHRNSLSHRSRTASGIVLPRSATDLPTAHRRVADLLTRGVVVRPDRLVPLAVGQARCCLLVEAALPTQRDTALTHLGDVLHKHAARLQDVNVRPWQLASLEPDDPRPLHQLAEIYRALPTLAGSLVADRRLLAEYTAAVADTTQGLQQAVTHAVQRGAWLVPDRESDRVELTWRSLRRGEETPDAGRSVAPVGVAAAHAARLADAARRVSPPAAAPTPSPLMTGPWWSGLPDAVPTRPRTPSEPLAGLARPARRR